MAEANQDKITLDGGATRSGARTGRTSSRPWRSSGLPPCEVPQIFEDVLGVPEAEPLRVHLELDEVAPAGLDARDEALLRLARRQHLAKDVPVRHGSRGELRYDLLFDGRELRAGGLAGLQAQGQAPGCLFVGRGMPQATPTATQRACRPPRTGQKTCHLSCKNIRGGDAVYWGRLRTLAAVQWSRGCPTETGRPTGGYQ